MFDIHLLAFDNEGEHISPVWSRLFLRDDQVSHPSDTASGDFLS